MKHSLTFGLTLLLSSSLAFAAPLAPKKGKGKSKKPKAAAPAETSEELNAAPTPAAESAPAADAPTYSAGYGMAGCGLGAEVIKEDGVVQIFAATTNGTVFNQSIGISIGSLHCKPSNRQLAAEQKVFVEANLVSLKREAASGYGETLLAFADLLGCDAQTFRSASQSHYAQIYAGQTADSILSSYKAVLPTQCSRLI